MPIFVPACALSNPVGLGSQPLFCYEHIGLPEPGT
jgi:hypothetical protein